MSRQTFCNFLSPSSSGQLVLPVLQLLRGRGRRHLLIRIPMGGRSSYQPPLGAFPHHSMQLSPKSSTSEVQVLCLSSGLRPDPPRLRRILADRARWRLARQ
mmetsp:Transcript_97027/g.230883  ORF Transcript_97027/g.230883 Transcript_97027/m.230883 type:complete len:101 (-) Transcript_97027:846-1148(-)